MSDREDIRRPLDRQGLARQRVFDASRVLSVLAAILFLFPLPGLVLDAGTQGETRIGAVYLFAVWLGLIILTYLLSRSLGREPVDD